ncbi:ATP-binding protein [Terrilactibacillus sp. S3-3]|nr:ATP-binding protein [Terrilactibacillus sp. S3-3]
MRILNNIKTLREITHHLYPEFIHKLGLTVALNELYSQVQKQSTFALHTHIDQHLSIFDRELEINLYRIIQELLNNAIKHSQADHVNLILIEEGKQYVLIYDDDGVGINKDEICHQNNFSIMGLPGLRGRVAITSGRITIDSLKNNADKKGLHIEIVWPLRTAPERTVHFKES